MNRRLVFVLLAGLTFTLAACAKAPPDDVESKTVVPVTTAAAERGAITALVHATGTVVPAPDAELMVVAPEAARIAEIPKAEGDTVRRGDLLVRFEIPSTVAEASKQRSEIGRAEARIVAARAAQARAKDLFARGVAARKEVEDADKETADAEADLATAHAGAIAADQVAARSVVHAPFDGIVAKQSHNPGDHVEATAADAVLRVVDPARLQVSASVPVADAPRVQPGAAARVVNPGAGVPAAQLKVASHPAAVNVETATVPVRLAFVTRVNYPVGAPVQVAIDAESHADVVLVPASALVHEGEETAVFVAAGDKAQRRAVTVGIESGERVEITSGVKAGEMVITSGQNGLPDGATIAPAK